ncbi:thioredoxin reductase domain protein, partial [Chlamydia psittaci 03DC29]
FKSTFKSYFIRGFFFRCFRWSINDHY